MSRHVGAARLLAGLAMCTHIKLEMPRVAHADLRSAMPGESSERVVAACAVQLRRAGKANAWLGNREAERDCAIDESLHALLERAVERPCLSARAYHRVLRVARTIADLAGSARFEAEHVSEAVHYRCFAARVRAVRRPIGCGARVGFARCSARMFRGRGFVAIVHLPARTATSIRTSGLQSRRRTS